MSERITDATELPIGSVVIVAVQGVDKKTNMPYWWRRFVYVERVDDRQYFTGITLKLELDTNCWREIDVNRDVVTLVEEHAIPQGISAILVKHLTKGAFKQDFPF